VAVAVFTRAVAMIGADRARQAGLGNVILTPHIAGVTQEANVRVSALTAQQVRQQLEKRG
jgi:phosphoglycerate dehydrogenase-like enzyme